MSEVRSRGFGVPQGRRIHEEKTRRVFDIPQGRRTSGEKKPKGFSTGTAASRRDSRITKRKPEGFSESGSRSTRRDDGNLMRESRRDSRNHRNDDDGITQ